MPDDGSIGDVLDFGQAPEFYVEDWGTPVIRHGVLTNVAFRVLDGRKVAVLRISQPVETVAGTQERVKSALRKACPMHEIVAKIVN